MKYIFHVTDNAPAFDVVLSEWKLLMKRMSMRRAMDRMEYGKGDGRI